MKKNRISYITVLILCLFEVLPMYSQTADYNQQARVFYNKALKNIKKAEYQQALEALNMAVELNGNLGKAYLERGKVRLQLNQIDEAADDFNKSITLNGPTGE